MGVFGCSPVCGSAPQIIRRNPNRGEIGKTGAPTASWHTAGQVGLRSQLPRRDWQGCVGSRSEAGGGLLIKNSDLHLTHEISVDSNLVHEPLERSRPFLSRCYGHSVISTREQIVQRVAGQIYGAPILNNTHGGDSLIVFRRIDGLCWNSIRPRIRLCSNAVQMNVLTSRQIRIPKLIKIIPQHKCRRVRTSIT